MKAVTTILFVLFFGLIAQARETGEQKVETIQMGLVQLTEIRVTPATSDPQVARLYRRADSRVKRELNFTTKKDYQMA